MLLQCAPCPRFTSVHHCISLLIAVCLNRVGMFLQLHNIGSNSCCLQGSPANAYAAVTKSCKIKHIFQTTAFQFPSFSWCTSVCPHLGFTKWLLAKGNQKLMVWPQYPKCMDGCANLFSICRHLDFFKFFFSFFIFGSKSLWRLLQVVSTLFSI